MDAQTPAQYHAEHVNVNKGPHTTGFRIQMHLICAMNLPLGVRTAVRTAGPSIRYTFLRRSIQFGLLHWFAFFVRFLSRVFIHFLLTVFYQFVEMEIENTWKSWKWRKMSWTFPN